MLESGGRRTNDVAALRSAQTARHMDTGTTAAIYRPCVPYAQKGTNKAIVFIITPLMELYLNALTAGEIIVPTHWYAQSGTNLFIFEKNCCEKPGADQNEPLPIIMMMEQTHHRDKAPTIKTTGIMNNHQTNNKVTMIYFLAMNFYK